MNQPVKPEELQFDDDGPLYVARKKVYPQSVSGTFRRIKWELMAFCLGVYYFLPFVRWNRGLGAPDQAVLIDLPNSRFYFFFIELWPQEVYYFTGLLIIAAVALSLAFHDELELAPGDTLTRRYRVVVAEGAWEREEVAKYLEEHPW